MLTNCILSAPVNTRLSLYLMHSPVGLRLVPLTQDYKSLTVSTFSSVWALRGLPLPGHLLTVLVSRNFLAAY